MLNGQKWLRGTNNSNRYFFVDQLLQYKIARSSTLLFDLFSPPILCWQTQVPGGACLAKTQQAVHSFQINTGLILLTNIMSDHIEEEEGQYWKAG